MPDPDAQPRDPPPADPDPELPAGQVTLGDDPSQALLARLGPAPLIAGAVLLVGALVWVLLPGGRDGGGQQRPPYVLPVRLAEVIRRDVSPHVELTGTLRAFRRAELAFTVSGLVAHTEVREADRVAAGQVLASLDAGDQKLALAERFAELELAGRELSKWEAGPRSEVKARLAAEVAVARAEQELARIEVERSRTLLSQKVAPQADLDRFQAAFDAARARADAAQARLDEAQAGSRLEDVQIAQAELARARVAHQAAERELAKTQLRAPWDGVVVRRFVSPGRVVGAGQPVFEVVDLRHLEVEVQIPSRYAHRLGERPSVTLTVDELPDLEVSAALDAQVPVADPLSHNVVGLIRLDVEQDPATGGAISDLRPGMFVRLSIQLAPLRDRLVVPADALRMTARGSVVVKAVPGEPGPDGKPTLGAQWVPVRVLGGDDEGAAVRPEAQEGGPALEPGDRVVTTGVDLAFPGAPLFPRPEPPAGEPGDRGQAEAAGQ